MAKSKKNTGKTDKRDKRVLFLRSVHPEVYEYIKETSIDKGYSESVFVNRIVQHIMKTKNTEML